MASEMASSAFRWLLAEESSSGSVLLVGIVLLVLTRRGQFRRPGLKPFGQRCLLVGMILICGFFYGAWRGALVPEQPEGWLGQPGTSSGLITAVYPSKTGTTVYVQLSQIDFSGVSHACNVRVAWRTSRAMGGQVHVGDTVILSGRLADRPIYPTTSPAKALAKPPVPLQPKTYEWLGRLQSEHAPPRTAISRMRAGLFAATALTPVVTPEHRQLADSILFGSGHLSPTLKQAFTAAGLLHVLAASGANILLIERALLRLLYPLWRRARLSEVGWVCAMIAWTWLFTGMCGWQPSILRAAVMSTYRWLGIATVRQPNLVSAVVVGAAAMTIVSPVLMSGPSAWLSYTATCAIAGWVAFGRPPGRMHPRQRRRTHPSWFSTLLWSLFESIRRWPVAIRSTLFLTLWIEVWMTPVVLWVFGQIAAYSVLSNLLCDPLLVLALPLVLAWVLLCALAHASHGLGLRTSLVWCATELGQLVEWMMSGLVSLVEWIAGLPGSFYTVQPISMWQLGFYDCALLVVVLLWIRRRQLRRRLRQWKDQRMRQRKGQIESQRECE